MKCLFCKQDTICLEGTQRFDCKNHENYLIVYFFNGYSFSNSRYIMQFFFDKKEFYLFDYGERPCDTKDAKLSIKLNFVPFFAPEEANNQIDRLRKLMVFS